MADQEKFERLAAEWDTTPEDVEATWSAGWDIDTGPPPEEFRGKHALEPEDAILEPTEARAVFHNDLYPGHTAEDLEAAQAQAQAEHQDVLARKAEEEA